MLLQESNCIPTWTHHGEGIFHKAQATKDFDLVIWQGHANVFAKPLDHSLAAFPSCPSHQSTEQRQAPCRQRQTRLHQCRQAHLHRCRQTHSHHRQTHSHHRQTKSAWPPFLLPRSVGWENKVQTVWNIQTAMRFKHLKMSNELTLENNHKLKDK